MYVSNQTRQRRYLKLRRGEEENALDQQQVLDDLIAEDLGLDTTADYLNKVNKRIADRLKKEVAIKNAKDLSKERIVNEQELMGREDELSKKREDISKMLSKTKPTEDQLKSQAEQQAALDLIALFQQDVKEGRKRQAKKDLERLNLEEDYRLRQVFQQALDDMMDEVNLRDSKKAQNEREILSKLMDLIEQQKLADAWERLEYNKNLATEEFAKKIQRNLKAAMENKKFMKDVKQGIYNEKAKKWKEELPVRETMDDLLTNVEVKDKISGRKVNKIPLQKNVKFNDIIQSSLSKNIIPTSPSNTSIMSDMPQKIDMRWYNPGANKKDTNVELENFVDVLQKFDKSNGEDRTKLRKNIDNIINRQKKINPLIADRMKNLYKGFTKK